MRDRQEILNRAATALNTASLERVYYVKTHIIVDPVISTLGIFPAAARSLRSLRYQFVEQGLRVLEIRGIEAFCEPVIDFGQDRAGFVAAPTIS